MITRRTTLPLLLLFLTLLAFFLWQQRPDAMPAGNVVVPTLETPVSLFPQQSLFSLREIVVRRVEDRTLVEVTHDGQGNFALVSPSSEPVDNVLLLEQLGALVSSASRRTLSGELASFGLDAPTHEIIVSFETADFRLATGNRAPDPTQIYVLRNDEILLLQTAVIEPLLGWVDAPPTNGN